MGIMKNFFSQTRKPEGFLGKIMLSGMNSGHAKLADWGISYLPEGSPNQIVELGCGAGRNAGELLRRFPAALKKAGFSVTVSEHHSEKPWIVLMGRKEMT